MAHQALPFSMESLVDLVEELRGVGYRVGIEQHVVVQDLLLSLAAHGELPEDPCRLVTLLGPVLCSTHGEQADFPERFERWLLRAGSPRASPEVVRSTGAEVEELARWSRKGWVAVAIVVVATVVVTLLLTGREPPRTDPERSVVDSPRPAPVTETKSPEPAVYPPLPDIEPKKEPAAKEGSSIEELAVILGLAVVVWLSFDLWWRRQARAFLSRRRSREPPLTHQLFVPGLGREIFEDDDLAAAALSLRRHRRVEDTELDVNATIEATVRAGGWLTPAMQLRAARPEYLALVSSRGSNDHAARYVDALLDGLQARDLYVDRYRYRDDPGLCSTSDGLTGDMSMLELAGRHGDHDLWLFADGAELFDPLDGEPMDAVDELSRWPRRAVVTLEREAEDDARAARLEELGLPMTTASALGLAELAGPTLPEAEATQAAETVAPHTVRQRARRWLEPTPPSEPMVELIRNELRAYLGEDGFALLCGCAVYPSIRWELTLFLDRQLDPGPANRRQRRIRIARLARLPWFRAGTMPDWLRLRLLSELPAQTLARIRDALRSLLLGALDRPAAGFELQIDESHSTTLQRLWHRIARHFRSDEHPGNPLRDRIFLTAMDDRLALSVGNAVLRAIRRDPGWRRRLAATPPPELRPLRPALAATAVWGSLLGVVMLPLMGGSGKEFLNWFGDLIAGGEARRSPEVPWLFAVVLGIGLARATFIVLSRSRPTIRHHLFHMTLELFFLSACLGLGLGLLLGVAWIMSLLSLMFVGGVLVFFGTTVLCISSVLYYRAPNAFELFTKLERFTGGCAPDDLRALERWLTDGPSASAPTGPRLGFPRLLVAGLVGIALVQMGGLSAAVALASFMFASLLSHMRARSTAPIRKLFWEVVAVLVGIDTVIMWNGVWSLPPWYFDLEFFLYDRLKDAVNYFFVILALPIAVLSTLAVSMAVALLQWIGRRSPTVRAIVGLAASLADHVVPDRLLERGLPHSPVLRVVVPIAVAIGVGLLYYFRRDPTSVLLGSFVVIAFMAARDWARRRRDRLRS